MIEQLGMRRPFAEQTEVARRADQASSEMMLPDAVDHDACGQRIGGIGDRSGQLQPTASVAERLRFGRAEDREEPARDFVSQFLVVAA